MGRVESPPGAERTLKGEENDLAELKRAVDVLLLGNGVLVLHLCRTRGASTSPTPPWDALELQALCILGRDDEAVRLARELLGSDDELGRAWQSPALTRSCLSVLAAFLAPDEVISVVRTLLQRFLESSVARSWSRADKEELLLRVWLRGLLLGESLSFRKVEDQQAWARRYGTDLEKELSLPPTDQADPVSIALREHLSAEALATLLERLGISSSATNETPPEVAQDDVDEASQQDHNQGCAGRVDDGHERHSMPEPQVGLGSRNETRPMVSTVFQSLHRRIQEDPALLADMVTYSLAGLAALSWLIYAQRRSRLRENITHSPGRGTWASSRFWQSAKDLLRSAFFFRF
ncbi:hypothetical protein CCYA_CCYA09G2569 [Cyanidiococcus yangmingshanensis]|nr:hypothetical protein CCYA_CCYA09G2569 [Cyanidiococcus yangmingshanensis]